MSAALRPYVTAGVALVGASIISVTPIAPAQMASPSSTMRVSTESVSLVADSTSCAGAASASALCKTTFPSFVDAGTPSAFQVAAQAAGPSVFNVPANLLIALANVPYNFLAALGYGDDGTGQPLQLGDNPDSAFSFTNSNNNVNLIQDPGHVVGLAADLAYAGSVWVYSPTNVLGTDPGDIPRYQALVNLAIPFPALSVGLGNLFAASAAALLPMSAGCTGTGLGACPDINSILSKSLNFSNLFQLFTTGFDYGTVRDPITCDHDGLCNILNPDGPLAPQSGVTLALNPTQPFVDFYNSLTQTPDFSSIKVPTMQMAVKALTGFVSGLNTFLNPFVLGTQCRLCAFLVPTPPGTIIPGPTNPGTQLPPFTPPVGPVGLTGTTLAKTADTDDDAAATPAKPSLKTWKAKHEALKAAQAQDAATAAAAVDAAGTVDPTPKSTAKHAKPDNPLAGTLKDAIAKTFKPAKSTDDATATAPKTTKTPKTPKAPKVAKGAHGTKGGDSGSSSE